MEHPLILVCKNGD